MASEDISFENRQPIEKVTKMSINSENNFDDAGGSLNNTNQDNEIPKNQVAISKSMLTKISVLLGALLIGIVGFFFVSANKSDSRLTKAVELCEVDGAVGIVFADDGQSLNFDGKGEEDFTGADYADLVCLLEETLAPSTVLDSMSKTTSLMGVMDAEWDGISVKWSYHPDRGLDASFQINK